MVIERSTLVKIALIVFAICLVVNSVGWSGVVPLFMDDLPPMIGWTIFLNAIVVLGLWLWGRSWRGILVPMVIQILFAAAWYGGDGFLDDEILNVMDNLIVTIMFVTQGWVTIAFVRRIKIKA